jgi:hypothetical protein
MKVLGWPKCPPRARKRATTTPATAVGPGPEISSELTTGSITYPSLLPAGCSNTLRRISTIIRLHVRFPPAAQPYPPATRRRHFLIPSISLGLLEISLLLSGAVLVWWSGRSVGREGPETKADPASVSFTGNPTRGRNSGGQTPPSRWEVVRNVRCVSTEEAAVGKGAARGEALIAVGRARALGAYVVASQVRKRVCLFSPYTRSETAVDVSATKARNCSRDDAQRISTVMCSGIVSIDTRGRRRTGP